MGTSPMMFSGTQPDATAAALRQTMVLLGPRTASMAAL
jgi:hypothetical protein